MSTALVSIDDMERMAIAIAKSNLFGMKTQEQVLALMLIAQAEGRHPAIVARDYDIIQGRPAKKSEAMLRDFLEAGGSVEWHRLDDDGAEATFSHPQGGSVRISWDAARAIKAGLAGKDMYHKYPRPMYRSRTVSEGVRTVWPAATSGLYEPGEVRQIATEDTVTVDVTSSPITNGNGGTKPAEKPPASGNRDDIPEDWTKWLVAQEQLLARARHAEDTAKTLEWLAKYEADNSARKMPPAARAAFDILVTSTRGALDIGSGEFNGPGAGVNQTPDNPDAMAGQLARKAEETWTIPILDLKTLPAIAKFKQTILPMIGDNLRPLVEIMVLKHQLTMETSLAKCLLIKKEYPELADHADRRIIEIKATMAEMQTGEKQ